MNNQTRKIIVLGGSFNPPTIAHQKLLKHAIDALNADQGLFVPVSDAYLRRKMRRSQPPIVFSPETRIKMLHSMCIDERMGVAENEIGTAEARTLPTLLELQEANPDAEIYFIMGADKINLLEILTYKGFFENFKAILYSRTNEALVDSLKDNPVVNIYLDSIVVLPQPEGTDEISSTEIRERLLNGKSCEDLVCPGVNEILSEFTPEDFPKTINSFLGRSSFMSNSYNCQFEWNGTKYNSVDEAMKWAEMSKMVFNLASSKTTSTMNYELIKEARIEIMESILNAKFNQNPDLMEKLLETNGYKLLNCNHHKDTFWGINAYTWVGINHLGKLLMKIREQNTK